MEANHCKLKALAIEEDDGQMDKHQKFQDPEEPHLDPQSFARSYQLEALEKAMEQNTIVFLETGTGKTLIAVMLLRAYAHSIRKPSDSIAVFLVPTVVLVSQQAGVIERHTDLKVGMFWGEMGVDFWSPATWKAKLEQYEVFVMTPQILLDNLRHSFFNLQKIKLLIFDECHHARGKHPYASVMTEFYHRQLKTNPIDLPRIFGMTASPINSKGSSDRSVYAKQIVEMESLMNSKVYTVATEAVLAQYVPFSTPMIKLYTHMDVPSELYSSVVNDLKCLKMKHLQIVRELMLDSAAEESVRNKIIQLHATLLFCFTELGVWSATKASETLSCKENYSFFWGERKAGSIEETVRKFSQDAYQIFSQYLLSDRFIGDDLKADVVDGLLTSKVHCLITSLFEYRMVQDLRCIIFVERVITAMVLKSLLCEIKGLSLLGIQYMAGNHCGLQSQTRREQMRIVDAFHGGKAKIIVATQILEEGLDVQSCNLVIRFDPAPTVRSFIQSRGRARMQGSNYLLLVRSDDSSTYSKVLNYLSSNHVMREECLQQVSLPCRPLKSEMYDEEFYCVETTGARVTLSSSVSLIYFYCSRLPSDGYFKSVPRFIIDKDSRRCTLYLPKSCPIQKINIESEADKLKQTACLEAIKKLHQIGALSDLLLPAFDTEIVDTDPDSGELEPYVEEQENYFPGELVDYWSSFSSIGLYHCYRITLNQDKLSEMSFRDIFLVVKSDVGSNLLSYSFCMAANRAIINVSFQYAGRVHLSHEQVVKAQRFQSSVLSVLIHHDFLEFKNTITSLHKRQSCIEATYLLLPSIRGEIDWDSVESAAFCKDNLTNSNHANNFCANSVSSWMQTADATVCRCMLQNAVVYTPHNDQFYCIFGILDSLNINSSLTLKGGKVLSYKEHFMTRYGVNLKWESAPLLSGRHMFNAQNFLLKNTLWNETECSSATVELPPELCKVIMCPISISVLLSFSFVPAIMHRIECFLLAEKLKTVHLDHLMQNVQVNTTKVLEAITTKKCQEEFSLESLETLGDSFLKYATSQYLFKSYQHHHQGILTALREKLISNASLCRMGCNRHLTGFLRTEQFDPKQWIIPGGCHSFRGGNQNSRLGEIGVYNRGTRQIKSKIVADSVEALIGACLSSAGELTAFHFLDWLGMGINFGKEMNVERPVLGISKMFVNVKHLENLLNYKFNDPSLLVEALTHGSYQVPDVPGCYQRLEFLGDAVLDFIITVHLYNEYPGLTPGLITDLRSASVNNDCYAHAAVKAGLNKHILHASSELHKQMENYFKIFSQSFSGSSYGWEAGVALPKVLADVIESISGAIYIDSKFDKIVVWRSIRPLLEPMVTPETMERHPVRELSEICSKKSYKLSFSKLCEDGAAKIIAEVEANGVHYRATSTGTNKKTAKKLAARDLLHTMKTAILDGDRS